MKLITTSTTKLDHLHTIANSRSPFEFPWHLQKYSLFNRIYKLHRPSKLKYPDYNTIDYSRCTDKMGELPEQNGNDFCRIPALDPFDQVGRNTLKFQGKDLNYTATGEKDDFINYGVTSKNSQIELLIFKIDDEI